MRRVVISGLGVVAPNGVGKDAFWQACVDGHSGIGPIRSFDASNHPIRVAGEVLDFDPEPYIPDKFRKSVKVMGRAARFGIGAAGLAVADSGLDIGAMNPERFGVVMGTGIVPMDLGELAPMLARACQEGERVRRDETARAGQDGLAAVPAVAAEVPAEHGGGAHLDGVQLPGAEQHRRDRVRRRHPGGRRGASGWSRAATPT